MAIKPYVEFKIKSLDKVRIVEELACEMLWGSSVFNVHGCTWNLFSQNPTLLSMHFGQKHINCFMFNKVTSICEI